MVVDSRTTPEEDLEVYRRMYLIRRFEETASDLYRSGSIPGFIHLAIGQEATAVGATYFLGPHDFITSTHRGHGHALARGLSPHGIFAELMGKETGICRGRGGSMHIADPTAGILGANGIVGAGLPIAVGASFAASLSGQDGVVLAFLGDGAVSTGAFHEAANLASLWKLPVIFFCENNGFAEFSRFEDQHPVSLETRAYGYGLRYFSVDGRHIDEVLALMGPLIEDLRNGGGPAFVEGTVDRAGGHYEGDPQRYRDQSPGELGSKDDPLEYWKQNLLSLHGRERIQEVEETVAAEINESRERAELDPYPIPGSLLEGVTRPALVASARVAVHTEQASMESSVSDQWKYFEAVREGLEASLEDDDRVFLAGVDVGRGGNVFGITRGLHDRWPNRVRDTPISESAIVGLAVGAAMAGFKPVVELMYLDFLGVCFDQILNQAAKLPYMTGGLAEMGLTVRSQFGAGRSSGAQHSQSLEAILAHIPGLTVVAPSTPADAYGLLRSAIESPNPVLVLENRNCYGHRGSRCDREYRTPIGQAHVVREGADVTIVSYSRMVLEAAEAASALERTGIDAEVIDLRTIVPMDVESVKRSVAKTGRLAIVQEAVTRFGVGAEIAAQAADDSFWMLDVPIVRLGAGHSPAPYSPPLEAAWLPQTSDIVDAVTKLCAI